jgi:hypothetical protein
MLRSTYIAQKSCMFSRHGLPGQHALQISTYLAKNVGPPPILGPNLTALSTNILDFYLYYSNIFEEK